MSTAAADARLSRLFADIVAAPDEDDARLVYADALIERGDPRGELIVLQVARAAGRGTLEQADRERELNRGEVLQRMAAPLALSCEAVTFERGFPVSACLRTRTVPDVVDPVEWATVRTLHGVDQASLDELLAMFASGRLANVVEVHDVKAERFDDLADYGGTWTELSIDPDDLQINALTRMPMLRALHLSGEWRISPKLLAGAPQLTDLTIVRPECDLELAHLERLPALRDLAVAATTPPPAKLAARAFPIETLGLFGPVGMLEPWLHAFPSVRELSLAIGGDGPEVDESPWPLLEAQLARPQMSQLDIDNGAGTPVRLTRSVDGWTLTLRCGNRAPSAYRALCADALQYRACGVTRVVIEPSQPRHYELPFFDMHDIALEDIVEAWAPVPVETREVLRWHGSAPDEGRGSGRLRKRPVR